MTVRPDCHRTRRTNSGSTRGKNLAVRRRSRVLHIHCIIVTNTREMGRVAPCGHALRSRLSQSLFLIIISPARRNSRSGSGRIVVTGEKVILGQITHHQTSFGEAVSRDGTDAIIVRPSPSPNPSSPDLEPYL